MLTPEFKRVTIDDRPHWRHTATGRTFPVISGGADGDGAGDGDTGGDSDADGTGDGADSGDGDGKQPDPAAEVAKWKAMARKHEQAAKANADAAKQLAEFQNAGKSESERQAQMIADLKASERASRIKALKLEVASTKGLTSDLAQFLPDLDDEVDMLDAADKLLAATGSTGKAGQPTRQPKSNLTNPLGDSDDAGTQRDALLNSMLGRAV